MLIQNPKRKVSKVSPGQGMDFWNPSCRQRMTPRNWNATLRWNSRSWGARRRIGLDSGNTEWTGQIRRKEEQIQLWNEDQGLKDHWRLDHTDVKPMGLDLEEINRMESKQAGRYGIGMWIAQKWNRKHSSLRKINWKQKKISWIESRFPAMRIMRKKGNCVAWKYRLEPMEIIGRQ